MTLRHAHDEGMALIAALLVILALSAIGAAMLVLSETETYASMNYRMMSQARYGAEAGAHRAVNFLINSYAVPGTAGDPLANYDTSVSPVTYNNQPVVLTSVAGQSSNYPVSAKATAFAQAVTGSLPAGISVNYGATATLIGMRSILQYGATTPTVIQTWRITGLGTLAGTRPAAAEVATVLERNVTPAHSFGVFAMNPTCGALTWGGASSSDSYDSTTMAQNGQPPATEQFGARLGTNGNLQVQGNAQVYGTLSTPRAGVGNCTAGAVTALTQTGQAQVTEGVIQLPQSLSYPPPDPPNPMPPTTSVSISGNSTCAVVAGSGAQCSKSGSTMTLDPLGGTVLLGNVTMQGGGATLRLRAGTYNINSFSMAGNTQLIIETGPVVFNIAGQGVTTPIDFTGGSTANESYLPTDFKILYGGTGAIKVAGNTAMAAMLYAPNSDVTLTGGSHFYGSIVGATVTDTGGTAFHFDRSLLNDFFVVGNHMLSAFTWKKN